MASDALWSGGSPNPAGRGRARAPAQHSGGICRPPTHVFADIRQLDLRLRKATVGAQGRMRTAAKRDWLRRLYPKQ